MMVDTGYVRLAARRCLPPSAVALFALALALACFLPFSPTAARGASELSPEIGAGLARQGVWLTALAVALPWFVARACGCVRSWRQGDGDWLGNSVLSRGSVALGQLLGSFVALAAVLAPFALAAELRAGQSAPALRWIGDSSVAPVVLSRDGEVVRVSARAPRGADVARARFVIAAPGDGGPRAVVRCSLGQGAERSVAEALVTSSAPLDIELRGAGGSVDLAFQRVGPGALAVLEDSRLQWLGARPARWSATAAMFLHAWLACAAACALALGVCAWTSAGTAFACVLTALGAGWLGDGAPLAWPGVALAGALQLSSDGLAPAAPAPITWIGTAGFCAVALGLVALQRDLWRRDA